MWKQVLVWWLLNNTNATIIKEIKKSGHIDTNGESWEDYALEGNITDIPMDHAVTLKVAQIICWKKRRMNKTFFTYLQNALGAYTKSKNTVQEGNVSRMRAGRYGGEY